MTLVHFNSWSNIDSLQHQLNRLLDDVIMPMSLDGLDTISTVPSIELHETDDAILLQVELPGIQLDDIDIEVTEDTVSVKGRRQANDNAGDQKATRSEFRYGTFSRVITLPSRVKNTDVRAEYRNGIVHLTLPKTDAEKHRVVKVNVSQ
ncbi:MAG: Hsp20/alpha crystallin family protein [Cyanobacteria bacterium P01_E01_bin.6]